MIIGVDYYPEHWDRSMWLPDAELMAKTGIKTVRPGEFAWCRPEPEDGRFDFGGMLKGYAMQAFAHGADTVVHYAFASLGLNVDIIGQHEDLSDYKIVCAPEMYVTDKSVVRRLYDFAEAVGTVILTNLGGAKDCNNNRILSPLPTVYSKLTGCHAEEYDPIGGDRVRIRFDDGETFTGKQWCDVLAADTAEVLAAHDSDFYKGKAAITVNRFGNGRVYCIGTVGEKALYRKIALKYLRRWIYHLWITSPIMWK